MRITVRPYRESDPDLIRPVPNFQATTWRALKEAGKLPPSRAKVLYSPRADGLNRNYVATAHDSTCPGRWDVTTR